MADMWKDIFMDEDPAGNPSVNLPSENEKEGEDNGQGSEAAGALSEDGNDPGIKDVPAGTDEISGEKSTEFDDVYSFLDEDVEKKDEPAADEPKEGEEDGEDKGEDDADDKEGDAADKKKKAKKRRRNSWLFDEEGKADEPAGEGKEGDDEGDDKGGEAEEGEDAGEEESKDCGGGRKRSKKRRRNEWSFFDEDPAGQPTVDLPSENEKEGEDNGQGSEAAGALSEDDDPEGMKTVPAGTDEISGEKSTEFDDVFGFMDEGDKPEGEGKADPAPASGDEQPEDNDEAEGDEDKAESSDKKKKAKKHRRNEFSIFDEDDKKEGDDDEGSDDDDASKNEPVKAPEGEEEEGKGEAKDEFAWSSFFDGNIEEPDNVPGDPEPREPVDGQGKEICPVANPEPNTELTEPILVPVESAPDHTEPLTNRKSISDRYFFN